MDLKKNYNLRSSFLLLLLKNGKFDNLFKLNLIHIILKNLVNNKLMFSFFKLILKEEYFLILLCLE